MSDLIDRESAMVRACAVIKDDYVAYDVVQALKAIPSAQPQSTMGQLTDAVQSTKDCISRQAAIDAFGERPMVWVGSDYELGARNQYDADVLALETVPSAQPQRWIPVSERLPDEWKRVLIQNDEGLFLVGFVKDRGWGKEWYYQYEMYDYDAYVESEQGKIVAWCELPKPWKGE